MISRRGALGLGAAGVLGAAGAGSAVLRGGAWPGEYRVRRVLGMDGPDGTVPPAGPVTVTTHRMHSAARGRDVNMITMVPTGVPAARLPVCLALHGRRNDAATMVALRLPEFLGAAVRAGSPPFAIVAVDGGDTYWIARTPGDDPQAMLRTELPGWLTSFGLTARGGVPASVLGVSMGCFGALVYADAAGPAAPAVAVLSPALFRSWPDARTEHAFAGQAAWAAAEPLRHPVPLSRLGVWCGEEDPFYPSARQLIAQRHPTIGQLSPGAHAPAYWYRVLPEALTFLATTR